MSTTGTTLDRLANALALRQHQAERALRQAWDAWERAEATGRATDAEARTAWHAHLAYVALMPPPRDLTPAEVAAQLAATGD